jgi:hypothetical protein
MAGSARRGAPTAGRRRVLQRALRQTDTLEPSQSESRCAMGKYVLGWILGVPVIVLVAIYFFMH